MSKCVKNKPDREFDVVLYGASSFVGRFVAKHLYSRQKQDSSLRIALAGRDENKLEDLKQELGTSDMPIIIAEASNLDALIALAAQSKVVASTVGPYSLYGSALVEACAEMGTDYCDLTAEIPWMHRMLERYESVAKLSGARIVHGCGFDSIPSDIGTWILQQKAKERFGVYCERVEMRLLKASGGFSGGTAASLSEMVIEATDDPNVRAITMDPYGITNHSQNGPQKDRLFPRYDVGLGQWSAPFIMAPINTRVVQRSHALAGTPWGQNFVYEEAMSTGKGLLGMAKAAGITVALGGLIGVNALKSTRPLIKRILPKPGEGPSLKSIENGFFTMRATGATHDGRQLALEIQGEMDPGYGSTARMLGESALQLAVDSGNQYVGGGFWTPSTAMGEPLAIKLSQHAGISIKDAA